MANTKKYVSLDKLGLYDEKIKGVISAGDAAALKSAKDYADGLAENYDAAGAAATAEANAKAYADGKDAAIAEAKKAGTDAQKEVDALELVVDGKASQTDLDALANKVGEVPEGQNVMGIIKNIQESAYDDTAIVNRIAAVETNKADKTQVATDIAAAVKAEEDARKEAVAGVQGAVDALSGTHATDKKALEDAIALKADITSLNEVSAVANAAVKQSDYDVKVKALEDEDARIVKLVEAEAERAAGVEAGLEERLVEVETFFKTAEGETIDQAMDTLVEIQKYITEDGAAADQMVKDIAANKKAIEDHVALDHDFASADAALKDELNVEIAKKADKTTVEGIDGRVEVVEGKVSTLEGKVSTLEGEMDGVQAAVATKVEQEAYNTKIAALEEADAGQVERIAALEAKFGEGEGNVEDMIADAKQEAIDAAADAADVKDAAILAEAKADSSNKDAVVLAEAQKGIDAVQTSLDAHIVEATAVAGRVTTVEGKVGTLETEMDAVEALAAANKAAHEANAKAIATKAATADLEALDARVVTLETWHNNFTEVSEEEINALFA